MSDSLPEMPSKSGLILKSAREEMSLSLEQVAHKLHLRPAVVKAIEEENYNEFSSDVFLKGYFRTYCRLVNLHEARMMDVLEQQLLSRKKLEEQEKQVANKVIQLRKRKKLFVTVAVFCVCLFLIAFAYQLTSQGFGNSSNISESDQKVLVKGVEPESIDSTNGVILSEKILQNELVDTTDIDAEVNSNLEAIDIFPEDQVDQNSMQETDLKTNDDLASYSSTEINDSEQENINSVDTEILTSIKALFSGDCWFKVTDMTGKSVIADLKKADEEVYYEGSAPFHIVLGDASKATLYFEGELVNLKPYTSRNGRAELTLKPSLSNSEG
jgi:cytoskeletal protein RodZ